MSDQKPEHPVILRRKAVFARTGLTQGSLYRQMQSGSFPRPVKLGGTNVGWVESEVADWIAARLKSREDVVAPSLEDQVSEIARLSPGMMVQFEGMAAPMRIADALTWIKNEAARDIEFGRLMQVAAACHAAQVKGETP